MKQANILLAAALVAAGATAYAGEEYDEQAQPAAEAVVVTEDVVVAENPTEVSETITVTAEQRRVIDALLS